MKKKKQPKPNAKQRELADEWLKLQNKWENVPSFARGSPTGRLTNTQPQLQTLGPKTPEAKRVIESFRTPGGSTAPAEKKVYTGDNMLGIAVMHKSNAVPVFNTEAAQDIAKMRRG